MASRLFELLLTRSVTRFVSVRRKSAMIPMESPQPQPRRGWRATAFAGLALIFAGGNRRTNGAAALPEGGTHEELGAALGQGSWPTAQIVRAQGRSLGKRRRPSPRLLAGYRTGQSRGMRMRTQKANWVTCEASRCQDMGGPLAWCSIAAPPPKRDAAAACWIAIICGEAVEQHAEMRTTKSAPSKKS